jgi:hypothetical protein
MSLWQLCSSLSVYALYRHTGCPVTSCHYFRTSRLRSFQSEISHEHRFNSQQLQSYRYLKFKIHVLQHRKSDNVLSLFCVLCILKSCGNLEEWGPVTAVTNSADHHYQSISQVFHQVSLNCGVPRHTGSTSVIVFCVIQDVWMTLIFYVRFKSPWISYCNAIFGHIHLPLSLLSPFSFPSLRFAPLCSYIPRGICLPAPSMVGSFFWT